MFWKQHKWKIIIPALIALALVAAFFAGGDLQETMPDGEESSLPAESRAQEEISSESLQGAADDAGELSCTLSISCATILENLSQCDAEKRELVPEDGWILKPTVVAFYAGESVFDVLQRTCRQEKIHMEFSETPAYNTAYIEAIGNLYEFDVGNLSGWMYKVNDWFPNFGCSSYELEDGDIVAWVYTCDLGHDVGGAEASGSEA